jgi:hypothetical protein
VVEEVVELVVVVGDGVEHTAAAAAAVVFVLIRLGGEMAPHHPEIYHQCHPLIH